MTYTVKFYTVDDFMFAQYTTTIKHKALSRYRYMHKLDGYAEISYAKV